MISSNLNTTHRLHILPPDVEFWSRSLRSTDSGWLISSVLFPINLIGVHRFSAVLDLTMWKVNIYDSTRSMNFFRRYKIGGEFQSFGDSIISKVDVIEYGNDYPDGHRETAIVEFIEAIDMPQ
ncbi:unnamed protein product [Lactuca saligna]|uniref:Uncharacterized protein n=1 Tax=Lactuca saligna TaxID=75948 RepID=A0AA35ZJ63_LACSI|nr:unnamed protein product [Lactuca saligna]